MLIDGHGQDGAATVEFYLVALLGLLPLCLGLLQTSLLLIENHHVDHAAFMATRSGATHQGAVGAMRREFARVMTPLFVQSSAGQGTANSGTRIGEAQIRAATDVAAFSRIQILSPAMPAQTDFRELRDGAHVIPSDSLQHRSNRPGPESGLSLQQANMLRVQFTYCRPVIIPFIRHFLIGLLRQIDPEPWNLRCYAAGRVPIRALGVAPMQSDFRVLAAAE